MLVNAYTRVVTIGEARAVARRWLGAHAGAIPGYRGAYLVGSTATAPDTAPLSPFSDVDVMVVTGDDPGTKPGKQVYEGALLEISYLPWSAVTGADGDYHVAAGLRAGAILDDPTGGLRAAHERIARDFAAPEAVLRRCAHVRQRIETPLRTLDLAQPWPRLVLAWVFPTGVTAHLPLVAALRNPTVRLRYVAVREVVPASVHDDLLRLLGSADLTASRVRAHVDRLAPTFDAAAATQHSPYPFSSDISAAARPIAIDGSHALVDRGDHREAMFWIVVTYARCHQILGTGHDAAFDAAVADLGIRGPDDIARRAAAVLDHLPALWRHTQEMVEG
jgi:hypothetical protein